LFKTLPKDPWDALAQAMSADAMFKCITLGADNEQGNFELGADWYVDGNRAPALRSVPTGRHKPNTGPGMQQVRAKVIASGVPELDYLFERERSQWEPLFAKDHPPLNVDRKSGKELHPEVAGEWRLVTGLSPRGSGEKDAHALALARPESGAFVLVSLRRRHKRKEERDEVVD